MLHYSFVVLSLLRVFSNIKMPVAYLQKKEWEFPLVGSAVLRDSAVLCHLAYSNMILL